MKREYLARLLLIPSFVLLTSITYAQSPYEISGSPYATDGAPLPATLKQTGEKVIVVDPREHAFGAYNAQGKLLRWG